MHIDPATLVHTLVQNKAGPSEAAFQSAIFCVLNGLLPKPLLCLFEVKAKNRQNCDLAVTQVMHYYEFKVNKITKADFMTKDGPIDQASKYASHYKHCVHLVNFYPEGNCSPAPLDNIPEDVIVVNIKHNTTCTKYEISTQNYYKEIRVIRK